MEVDAAVAVAVAVDVGVNAGVGRDRMTDRGYISAFVGGCLLLYGPDAPVPGSPLKAEAVLGRMSEGSVVDRELAARIGASLVVGLREDLDRLPVDQLLHVAPRAQGAETSGAELYDCLAMESNLG